MLLAALLHTQYVRLSALFLFTAMSMSNPNRRRLTDRAVSIGFSTREWQAWLENCI